MYMGDHTMLVYYHKKLINNPRILNYKFPHDFPGYHGNAISFTIEDPSA
jgi:hypothetical protein